MDMTLESCRFFVEMLASSTPSPGGVGAVTNTVLMKHVIEAAEQSLER